MTKQELEEIVKREAEKYEAKVQNNAEESYSVGANLFLEPLVEAITALEFYSNEDNYRVYHHALSAWHDKDTKITNDKGEAAYSALSRIEKLLKGEKK